MRLTVITRQYCRRRDRAAQVFGNHRGSSGCASAEWTLSSASELSWPGSRRCRVSVARYLRCPPVNHGSAAPSRRGRHTAPVTWFARRIGWREPQFAQHCAE